MAQALGFRPDSLIRNIPDPKQKWKLPVKYWIRSLYEERFGCVRGEKAVTVKPLTPEKEAEEARRFEEELYWEDYWDRNSDDIPKDRKTTASAPREPAKVDAIDDVFPKIEITDLDVPF